LGFVEHERNWVKHLGGISMKLSIAKGNSKLGTIPNISLTPGKSCGGKVCSGCYAMKSYRMYPSVRKAWDANLDAYESDSEGYFEAINKYLAKHKPSMFRWHVAGDIPGDAYLAYMLEIADLHPGVKFLAFTKRHDLITDSVCRIIPSNLSIILSMWPGMPVPDSPLPRAWMQDGTETRVPDDAIPCHGHCDSCGMCWSLASIGRDVVFSKH
jgi:hypothetical protein